MGARDSSPPEGVHHYEAANELPVDISKYWHQRHEIFSKYDEGVWMTNDAWFGVTPEPVANKIADHLSTAPKSKTVLIDAFAGAGGNTIAFARSGRWRQIFAVEKDVEALACAKHNAQIYGVANKIWFIHGDIFEILKGQLKSVTKRAVLFGSPPWGGPSYTDFEVYDLNVMQPYPLDKLYTSFSSVASEVALYLPRTSDLRQLAKNAKDDKRLNVTHYCMHGASKALCVYYGDFATT